MAVSVSVATGPETTLERPSPLRQAAPAEPTAGRFATPAVPHARSLPRISDNSPTSESTETAANEAADACFAQWQDAWGSL